MIYLGRSSDYINIKGQVNQKRLGNPAIGDEGFYIKEWKIDLRRTRLRQREEDLNLEVVIKLAWRGEIWNNLRRKHCQNVW